MISVSRYLVSFGYRNQDFSGRSPHLTYKLRAKDTKVLPRDAYTVGGGRWLSLEEEVPGACHSPGRGKGRGCLLDFNFSGILFKSSSV